MNEVITKENNINIEDMIYEIRGKQVMLSSDLAKLYRCKNGTKEINQAVSRNQEKFPERFSWKLTDEESSLFLVTNCDQKIETRGGKFKNQRVFTEEGVAMLATILKTDVATRISIQIMDAFIAMRRYIGNNRKILLNIENKIIEHDNDIKLLQQSFQKFEEKRKINEIYFNGQIYDAYSKIVDIMKKAKEEIIIIDSYADKTILDMISKLSTKVILITKENNKLSELDISKYHKQYDNLEIIYNNTFHDRYIILDSSTVYHLGTGINRAGSKTFSTNILTDEFIISSLLNYISEIISKGEYNE